MTSSGLDIRGAITGLMKEDGPQSKLAFTLRENRDLPNLTAMSFFYV